jgi:hypothetical protein
MDPAWATALIALVAAVFGAVAWAARWAWAILRRIVHFLDDFGGQPARDGLPARPGLMARMESVEQSLAHVVTETSPNHGTSLRDIVIRTAADVADIKHEQAGVRTRLELLQGEQARRDERPHGTTGKASP